MDKRIEISARKGRLSFEGLLFRYRDLSSFFFSDSLTSEDMERVLLERVQEVPFQSSER